MQINQIVKKPLRLREVNYFDHLCVVTMRPSQINVNQMNIQSVHAGDFVNGNIKSIVIGENNQPIRILLQLSPTLQGLIPGCQLWDHQTSLASKYRQGARLRARVLKVDTQSNSLILTMKPTLLQKELKIVSSLEQINYSEQIYGFVQKQIQNGFIIGFFQGVTGLLSLKEIETSGQSSDDISVGQSIKVYVKYVNATEGKLLLTLRKIESVEENEAVKQFKEHKRTVTQQIENMQLQHIDTKEILGKTLRYRIRKNQPDSNLLILDYVESKRKNSIGSIQAEIQKHSAILLKEQVTHSIDSIIQTNIITTLRDNGGILSLTVISNPNGACLVSKKFEKQGKLQVHKSYLGYIVELNARYALISIGGVTGCPTGILNLDSTKQLNKLQYMQTIPVTVKSLQQNKISFEIAQNLYTAFQQFQDEEFTTPQEDLPKVGNFVQATVSILKDYGAITQITGATGFIMNHNLKNTKKVGDIINAQIIDADYGKKVFDLNEINDLKQNKPIKLDKLQSGQIILVKESYSIVKLKFNNIGFLWTPKGIYHEEHNIQVGETVNNLFCINMDKIKQNSKENTFNKSTYVPIFVQSHGIEEELVEQKQQTIFKKGEQITATVTSVDYNYVKVNLPGGGKGRIHKSQFEVQVDTSRLLGYSSSFESLEIGSQVNCHVLKVPHRFLMQKIIELTTLQTPVLMCGNTDKDAGKELIAVVKHIKKNIPLTLEGVGGYVIGVNAWDCNLVELNDGSKLNRLEDHVKIGDVVKVHLKADKNQKIIGVIQRPNTQKYDAPVEIFEKQIFKVLSHHGSSIRVQLKDNFHASIDITELNDQWIPKVLDGYPRGTWGSCRLYREDEKYGFWASSRPELLDDQIWNKCLHPVKSSSLNYQKQLKPLLGLFDLRFEFLRNISLPSTIAAGTLTLGYVTSVTDAGAFVRWAADNSCTVLIPTPEITDDTINTHQFLNMPVLVRITQNINGRALGSMRYSVISTDASEPKPGEVVQGTVIELKQNRASIKLVGCLLQAELDKQNAEGAEGEDGWFAEKLIKVGQSISGVVLSIKELPNGKKIVKITNVQELVDEKIKENKVKKVIQNKQAIEVYESLQQIIQEYQEKLQQNARIEEEQVEEVDQIEQVEEVEEGQINEDIEEEERNSQEEEMNEQQEEIIDQIDEEIDETTLQNRAEFEKQILTNPNSSQLWVKFASYVMESEGIEHARSIMERALRVINFTNENERLNLWTSYINLEFHFGTEERLINVFKNACNACNSKQVHLRLISTYKQAQKWDLMVELARSMVNKFKQSLKCWNQFIECLVDWTNQQGKSQIPPSYDIQMNLHRAMQCLKTQKHPLLLAHYGRVQFNLGQIEQGKTTFDALIQKYPKRTDLLGQYIDLCAKYCTQQQTRQLFEKSIQMKLNPHKIKFIFKKWLEYESIHGSQSDVESIQKRAYEWVQAYRGSNDEEVDDE